MHIEEFYFLENTMIIYGVLFLLSVFLIVCATQTLEDDVAQIAEYFGNQALERQLPYISVDDENNNRRGSEPDLRMVQKQQSYKSSQQSQSITMNENGQINQQSLLGGPQSISQSNSGPSNSFQSQSSSSFQHNLLEQDETNNKIQASSQLNQDQQTGTEEQPQSITYSNSRLSSGSAGSGTHPQTSSLTQPQPNTPSPFTKINEAQQVSAEKQPQTINQLNLDDQPTSGSPFQNSPVTSQPQSSSSGSQNPQQQPSNAGNQTHSPSLLTANSPTSNGSSLPPSEFQINVAQQIGTVDQPQTINQSNLTQQQSSSVSPSQYTLQMGETQPSTFDYQPESAAVFMIAAVDKYLWSNSDDDLDNLNSSKADETVEEQGVIFRYYNKQLPTGEMIFIQNISDSTLKGWRQSAPLKIITHGWLSSDHSVAVEGIKNAYLEKQDVNIITVDWSESASWKAYPLPAYMTQQVGVIVARLINELVKKSMVTLDDVHIIGHSLGSHVAGASGAAVENGRVSRITGLDPAGPGFELIYHLLQNNVLDPSDASFVDVIHTAAGVAGFYSSIGHVDFYPNGGTPIQPGCSLEITCSHGRAYEFFKYSILYPHSFKAWQCDNWELFDSKSCDNNPVVYMGDETPSSTRGVYYLITKGSEPYGNEDPK